MNVNAIDNHSGNLVKLSNMDAAKPESRKTGDALASADEKTDKAEISGFARMHAARLRMNQDKDLFADNAANQQTNINDSSQESTNSEMKESGPVQVSANGADNAAKLESQLQSKQSEMKSKQEQLKNLEQQGEGQSSNDDSVRSLKNKLEQLKKEVKRLKTEFNQN